MSSLLTDEALGDIQGVITSGYGHLPQAAYLFIRMTNADRGAPLARVHLRLRHVVKAVDLSVET